MNIITIKTNGWIYISILLKHKAVYMCVYIYIYLFTCSELIEETGRFPNVIFGI